jgi:hypothetical protein
MGFIIDVNDHLSVEVRRTSFMIHDDELQATESPEFGYNRVFPLIAALEHVKNSERFQAWLKKEERK